LVIFPGHRIQQSNIKRVHLGFASACCQ
jgi:hypothetical protein